MIGYYHDGSAADGFWPEHVAADKLTHAIFAFADVSDQGRCRLISDTPAKLKRDQQAIVRFAGLKRRNPSLLTSLSIGGASHSRGYVPFRDLPGLLKAGVKQVWDERAKEPVLVNAATREVVSYDDERSLEHMEQFLRLRFYFDFNT